MVRFVRNVALGCTVALAFFAVLEGLLAGAGVEPLSRKSDPYVGFAGFSSLFVERLTPEGARVFETAPGKLQWFNSQRFRADKAPGTRRLFCMGGSTTYGRPYDDRTSFCGWLRAYFQVADPTRPWEVINAGGISYASYRVARLMESFEPFEPDVYVIYTGHNEFLEERTYRSVLDTPEFVRDAASLGSRLRLYTALSDLILPETDELPTEVTAVLDRSVGPETYHRDDTLEKAVLEHFRASLERMITIAQSQGAETILVTPASNVGDFAPFKSEPGAGMNAEAIQQVALLGRAATTALDEGDAARAILLATQALQLDPRNPDLLYLDGRALQRGSRPDEAKQAFLDARDEDVAPLRATSEIIEIVSQVAQEQQVPFVDFVSMIEQLSPDGIPGQDFFLDHVHPTIEADRLLALAILDEMALGGLINPTSAWDDEAIQGVTARLLAGVDESAHALARRSLANVLIWAGKHEEAGRLVDLAADLDPETAETHFQKAILLRREGRDLEALPQFEEAIRLAPGDAATHKAYGVLLSELGRKNEARPELEAAVRLDPTLVGVYYELGVVLADLGAAAEAEAAYRASLEREPDNPDALNNLGVLLAQRGDIAGALSLFERAVRADPSHTNARSNLAQARGLPGR